MGSARTVQRTGPEFDFKVTYRGSSTFFAVYYDDSFGPVTGASLADGVLARCDADYDYLNAIFGAVTPPLPMTCIVWFGNYGYHYGCLDNVLYAGGLSLLNNNAPDVATASALLVAEETEVFEAAQAAGWNCFDNNGEGLSRTLAEDIYPGILDTGPVDLTFRTADFWLDNGRPDYVTYNAGTDEDNFGNGCAVVFLYYLRYILGYDWATIVRAGGSTLEQTYQTLTGQSGGYAALRSCVDALYPPDTPSGVITDNPFPACDLYLTSVSLL